MSRYLLILLLFLIATGCEEERQKRSQKEVVKQMDEEYQAKLVQHGIQDLHDEIKWRLYCNHCDVPVKSCMGNKMNGLTYGMLDMKIFYLKFDDGVGEIAYTFIYNDSLQCTISEIQGNKIHGVGFSEEDGKLLYFLSAGETEKVELNCDTMANISECPTRMINPDQPVVRKYLERNRKKLDPWFHMEAVKRGFFDN